MTDFFHFAKYYSSQTLAFALGSCPAQQPPEVVTMCRLSRVGVLCEIKLGSQPSFKLSVHQKHDWQKLGPLLVKRPGTDWTLT